MRAVAGATAVVVTDDDACGVRAVADGASALRKLSSNAPMMMKRCLAMPVTNLSVERCE